MLVHGWLKSVANGGDYYSEQGFVCTRSQIILNLCTWAVPPQIKNPRSLPARAYVAPLIAVLERDLANQYGGAPLYVFDYQSFSPYQTSARELADSLTKVKSRDSLEGFVIVGHSMGGLVARAAAQLLEKDTLTSQTILGILSLATPHMGTPLPALTVAGVFWPGITSPGGQSLLPQNFLPRSEHVALIAYGGDIDGVASRHRIYYSSWRLLCANVRADCKNDGVVPVSSALPDRFASTAFTIRRNEFSIYDHSQMAYGDGPSQDPLGLYSKIAADLSMLLRRAGADSLWYDLEISGGAVGAPLTPVRVSVRDGRSARTNIRSHSP